MGLDELRGIAILAVMLAHGAGMIPDAPAVIQNGGHVGVVLFFYCSGFIITKILVGEATKVASKNPRM